MNEVDESERDLIAASEFIGGIVGRWKDYGARAVKAATVQRESYKALARKTDQGQVPVKIRAGLIPVLLH